jgi:hypothetical protein
MSSNRVNYRKIWSDHYGPIPKDEQGRSYEIHHIDGNRSNNDLSNLMCVSIQEHYIIHKKQKDYAAALWISNKLNLSKEEILSLAKIACLKKIERGTSKIAAKKAAETKRKNGTLDEMYKKIAEIRKLNGTNNINGAYKKRKAILQYDLNGNFIKEWESVNQARDFCGGSPHKAASSKQKQSNGFIWKYKNN